MIPSSYGFPQTWSLIADNFRLLGDEVEILAIALATVISLSLSHAEARTRPVVMSFKSLRYVVSMWVVSACLNSSILTTCRCGSCSPSLHQGVVISFVDALLLELIAMFAFARVYASIVCTLLSLLVNN